ncbi:Anthranilate/para-aminobenzoate synthase component I [Halalkaliarchaeum sp. AArc-CO]|uniref:anthranilate synthase component I n=1 Tax=unclassified Halalkaliarchaeum TaxID=2678344 RepID=UPI00217EBB45|nr:MULTISPECIES: anthranilate synthase component I [unclassified Halalkaliarchaeum]MDR5672396.1 anthranilate synthase component I [Halalkaliarchaeum sp. AArc-GB]UWG49974.1 Anthranilate/para-aminobenzoate synthase component I [Halalkaliarchaeum sp. AArc-CO]
MTATDVDAGSAFELDRTREEFCDLAAGASGPAVVRLSATLDVDTSPLSAYAALTADNGDYTFLLESARKVASSDPDGAFAPGSDVERHARYSFVGYDPDAVISVYPDRTDVESFGPAAEAIEVDDAGDTLDRLRASMPTVEPVGFPETDRQQLSGGLVGFLAYDSVYDIWLEEVGVDRPEPIVPDAQFCLTTRTLVFDDVEGTVELVLTPFLQPEDDPGDRYDALVTEAQEVAETLSAAAKEPVATGDGITIETERAGPREEYEDAVRRAKRHVLDGDIYQGVISRTREFDGEVDPLALYAALRDVNPSPYMYLLSYGDRSIVGASPETLVSVQGRRLVSNPIAGTGPRGDSPAEDRRLAGEMLADDKERAEHTMLVDLARNDVRRVSTPGSVRVEEFMNVLKYSHVQHIESTVTGRLAADADAFDATRATFPAGTLTGAPKIRAMEIIDDLETTPRGVYGGGVGYYSWTGDADMAIVIRTATIDHEETVDRLTVRAGAGLVADSEPTAEYDETEHKMDGVLAAVDRIDSTTDLGASR